MLFSVFAVCMEEESELGIGTTCGHATCMTVCEYLCRCEVRVNLAYFHHTFRWTLQLHFRLRLLYGQAMRGLFRDLRKSPPLPTTYTMVRSLSSPYRSQVCSREVGYNTIQDWSLREWYGSTYKTSEAIGQDRG